MGARRAGRRPVTDTAETAEEAARREAAWLASIDRLPGGVSLTRVRALFAPPPTRPSRPQTVREGATDGPSADTAAPDPGDDRGCATGRSCR
jgi:hypothetical protein